MKRCAEQSQKITLQSGRHPHTPREMMMAFIDVHREGLGIEPICRELAIAPPSYHEHAARRADPGRRPARVQRDDEIR